MEIKVIGAGCEKCGKLYDKVCEAVKKLGVDAQIQKVDDLMEIVQLGVLSAPSLMVNGKLVVSGRVPNVKTLTEILKAQEG